MNQIFLGMPPPNIASWMKAQHQKAKLEQLLKTPFYVVSDTDNTLTWTSVNGVKINWSLNEDLTDYHELPADTTTEVSMQAGKKLYLFCTEDQPAFYATYASDIHCANEFSVGGNICFLSEASCYKKTESRPKCRNVSQFCKLFNNTKVIDASKMVLGFSELDTECCAGMFKDCTYLVSAPELPVMALAFSCYANMFSGCTSLVNTPVIPAVNLATYCYEGMFKNCTSLVTAPALPATTLDSGCYIAMFSQCTSLVTAPALPATTLASNCYNAMFSQCTSLVTAPALPATALDSGCYFNVFTDCIKITDLHFPKSLENDTTFLAMMGAPTFGATNAVVHYDL